MEIPQEIPQGAPGPAKSAPPPLVRLNVGGHFYTTTRTTLSAMGGFLAALVGGEFGATLDDQGRMFIDRDGQTFGAVLDFLRTGVLFVDWAHAQAVARLRIEADFYQLPQIEKALQAHLAAQREAEAREAEDEAEAKALEQRKKMPTGGINPFMTLIEVNVGGRPFATLLSTIGRFDRYGSTMTGMRDGALATAAGIMAEGDRSGVLVKDDHGRVFFDRDPGVFPHILHFLRCQAGGQRGRLRADARLLKERIADEATFYLGSNNELSNAIWSGNDSIFA